MNITHPHILIVFLAAVGLVAGCGSHGGTTPDGSTMATADSAARDGAGNDAAQDVAMIDMVAADAGTNAAALPDASGSYGQPCAVGDDTTCDTGLFCLQGPSGGSVGFCTHTCPATSEQVCAGTPPGTAAYCVVTGVDNAGDKGCAFVCGEGTQRYPCPGALQCQTTDDPAGSGQFLCLP